MPNRWDTKARRSSQAFSGKVIMNKVDVIFPTCDRDPTKSLESILRQTFRKFKIIICNDGKEKILDLSQALFDQHKFRNYLVIDPGTKYQGASAARNECLGAGSSKYVAFLDDDDEYFPDHLEILVNFLDAHSDVDFAFSKAWGVKEKDCQAIRAEIWIEDLPDGKVKGFLPAPYYQPEMIYKTNICPTLTVMMRRECLEKIGGFNEDFVCLNDWAAWAKIVLAGYKMAHINKFTAEYSIHGSGLISKYPVEAVRIANTIRSWF